MDSATKSYMTRSIQSYKSTFSLLDFNCPNLLYAILFKGQELKQLLASGDAEKAALVSTSINGWYNLIHQHDSINSKEIFDLFLKFKDFFDLRKLEAELTNKKILVVIGESHYYQEPLLLEAMILTYLSTKSFSSLLIEHTPAGSKNIISEIVQKKSNEFPAGYILGHVILKYDLHGIDPDKKVISKNSLHIDSSYYERDAAIHQSIAMYKNQNQVCIVGSNHLKGIFESKIINDSFVIIPIDVHVGSYRIKEYEPFFGKLEIECKQALRLELQSNIESFSHSKILQIYSKFLPVLLGTKSDMEDIIFRDDSSSKKNQCSHFEVVESYFEELNSYLLGLYNAD